MLEVIYTENTLCRLSTNTGRRINNTVKLIGIKFNNLITKNVVAYPMELAHGTGRVCVWILLICKF
jgi:hypothetical protein